MLLIKCSGEEVKYYSIAEASKLISSNQWGVPVDGIHSETLRRTYRDFVADPKNTEVAFNIGRDIFFSEDGIKTLGYGVKDKVSWMDMGQVVQLFPKEQTR